MPSDENDEMIAATTPPAVDSNKTPVSSSGGMTMRSGKKTKKNKRSAFTATTPAARRKPRTIAGAKNDNDRKKRSAAAEDDTEENNGARKRRRPNHVGDDLDGDEDMEDATNSNDEDWGNGEVEMDPHGIYQTATATKVRFETTKEAVAAAQLAESEDDDDNDGVEGGETGADCHGEGGDDDDEDELANAAAAAEEQVTGWRRLLLQRLRLPSQHTPAGQPPPSSSRGPPPPAGGRRLIFDTGGKNKESTQEGSSTTFTRNKLLMQTRTGTMTNPSSSSSRKTMSRRGETTKTPSAAVQQRQQQSTTTPPSSRTATSAYYVLWWEELSKNTEFKRDIMKCTMAWFTLLFIFFVIGNVTNNNSWDVRVQSLNWSEWYGISTTTTMGSGGGAIVQESDVDSVIAETETSNNDDVEEKGGEEEDDDVVVTAVVDPDLLRQARAILRAQRMNQHDIKMIENAIAEVILAIKMLDSVEDELLDNPPQSSLLSSSPSSSASSSSSSSLTSLSSRVTDPVDILKYIESVIETNDVVIFSKSFCPYCKQTKELFAEMNVLPVVIELDEMDNGSLIQEVLSQITGQETVPNVFVKKQHVGGNDDTHDLAESGELKQLLSLPEFTSSGGMDQIIKSTLDSFNSNIREKQRLLDIWEDALVDVESALDLLEKGLATPNDVNPTLSSLSEVSMVPFSAMALDAADILLLGEGCEGKDYTPLNAEKENIVVDVVGGVDVDALDIASDVPLTFDHAQSAYDSLVNVAQSTSEALIGPTGPSARAQRWVEQLVKEACQKEGVDDPPSDQVESSIDITKKGFASSGAYNAQAASEDIDRLLEIEDADRTGKFDYASVVHGARVLRRGPRATSLSLYETLPLTNRLLAYSKLRFYGHPPEVALRPATTMYARGHCWSFGDEFSSKRARHQMQDGLRGEYATLTVALSQEITVTEVVIDHAHRSNADSNNGTTALKMFRVIGYEDKGAFGEPWELGSFQYGFDLGLQTFAIPTSIGGGVVVPKLKAVTLAVDSNWGAEYSCLYRFRVHGG